MHLQSTLALVAFTLTAAVKADFQLYNVLGYDVFGAETEDWQVFDGEPSCDDVNNGYASFPRSADVSEVVGVRCDGCDNRGEIRDPWDVRELEINGGDWGHFTIYKDSGYQLTPRDGGPLRGSCVQDTADDFSCTGVVTTSGIRVFRCTSDLGGIRAR